MSLLSSAPFSSDTTYRKDFYRKQISRRQQYRPIPECENPIKDPWEEHVLPNFKYKQLEQPQTKYPDPKEYAEFVAENYPSTRVYLRDPPGGPPDLDVIDELYQDDSRTVYMVSYCERGDFDSKKKRENLKTSLPDGWIIPLTTQTASYRPPQVVAPEGIPKISRRAPRENLSPNQKERAILDVKTGETIYISDISNTGMEIINGKLHGDVNIRPKFDEDDLLKAMLIRRE